MTINLDKYQHHVSDFGISEAAQRELLETVWLILESFVDRAYGCDATQFAITEPEEDAGISADYRLASNYRQRANQELVDIGKGDDDERPHNTGGDLRPRF